MVQPIHVWSPETVRRLCNDDTWEKVHTAFNDAELHLIIGILAGEGLECRVWSDWVPQLPFSHGALGVGEIYVPKSEAPVAQRLLLIYRNVVGSLPQQKRTA
jgi:hypothetical protein